LQSTRRLKWERKSMPIRGCVTSATMNRHVKSWLSLRLCLRGHPSIGADGSAIRHIEVVADVFLASWDEPAGVHRDLNPCHPGIAVYKSCP
jgi:hypothetical protein